MTEVLVVRSSILGADSVSNSLIDQFLGQLAEDGAISRVVVRDLGNEPLPPLNAARLGALVTDPAKRNRDQQELTELSDQLITELQQADLVLLGAPMYNFTIPAGLKTWFDHVARAGVTFKYTEQGPVGLLEDKQVVVFATTGGVHKPGESDHVRPYLKTMLNFLGLEELEFIAAGGLNLGEEPRQRSLREAQERLIAVADKIGARLVRQVNSEEVA